MSEFIVGQDLYWTHGAHSHRVAVVLEVTADKVKLQGVTKDYWMSKKALTKKINQPYPVGGSVF